VKMKKIILIMLALFTGLVSFSQKINGQWRGFFDSYGNNIILSGDDNTEYVLEIEISGSTVSGYSYSYFQGRKFYVICKLDGVYNAKTKSIQVTETERIKGNTPPDFSDCLQVHYLTYTKENNLETLSGTWKSAPGQRPGCGEGKTTLTRRTLSNDLSSFNKAKKDSSAVAKKDNTTAKSTPTKKVTPPPPPKNTSTAAKPKPITPVTKSSPKSKPATTSTTTTTAPPVAKAIPDKKEMPTPITPEPKKENNEIKAITGFEKRKTDLLKTIQIENETFKVDLYDNGEVDGDSVSVFYNGKLILSHKRLSEKPISLTLDATTDNAVNELTMYAENLGEIPPNTALMVVTDGEKRYEVRISSDYKNSGTIHFVHHPKTQ
jgi:hypothetical protein